MRDFFRITPAANPFTARSPTGIHIVESHDAAFQVLSSRVGRGHLPRPEHRGLTMLHFDAHPDLLVPDALRAGDCVDRVAVAREASIAEWILPMVYTGPISVVVWLKPPWACQTEDGVYEVFVGEHKESGLLRVSSPLDYYTDEGAVDVDELVDPIKLTLCVVTVWPHAPSEKNSDTDTSASDLHSCRFCFPEDAVPETHAGPDSGNHMGTTLDGKNDTIVSTKKRCKGRSTIIDDEYDDDDDDDGNDDDNDDDGNKGNINDKKNNQNIFRTSIDDVTDCRGIPITDHVVLDICLDFFSTCNPWRPDTVSADDHLVLRRAYFPDLPDTESISKMSAAKKRYSDLLEQVITEKDPKRWVSTTAEELVEAAGQCIDMWADRSDGESAIRNLHRLVSQDGFIEKFDGAYHESACLSDLPYHPSGTDVMEGLLRSVESISKSAPKPLLVTISRSVDDGYTPLSQGVSLEDESIALSKRVLDGPFRVARHIREPKREQQEESGA